MGERGEAGVRGDGGFVSKALLISHLQWQLCGGRSDLLTSEDVSAATYKH